MHGATLPFCIALACLCKFSCTRVEVTLRDFMGACLLLGVELGTALAMGKWRVWW